jgi:hypothetical protein
MNAGNKRVKESENFGARITEIGVAVQRYGRKNFRDLFVIFGKWLGVYLELFSKIQGDYWRFVDCRLILNKYRGLFAKWWGFLDFRFIS